MNEDELIERLADQEHERWSSWMRHMFDHWNDKNVTRWKQLMNISYADLPEHSKESDRKEARKTMEIVGPIVAQLEGENEQLEKAVEYAKSLCYKHSNGDDACHCKFYNVALGLVVEQVTTSVVANDSPE